MSADFSGPLKVPEGLKVTWKKVPNVKGAGVVVGFGTQD